MRMAQLNNFLTMRAVCAMQSACALMGKRDAVVSLDNIGIRICKRESSIPRADIGTVFQLQLILIQNKLAVLRRQIRLRKRWQRHRDIMAQVDRLNG